MFSTNFRKFAAAAILRKIELNPRWRPTLRTCCETTVAIET